MKNSNKGFSLLELIIAIGISGISVFLFTHFTESSNNVSKEMASNFAIRSTLVQIKSHFSKEKHCRATLAHYYGEDDQRLSLDFQNNAGLIVNNFYRYSEISPTKRSEVVFESSFGPQKVKIKIKKISPLYKNTSGINSSELVVSDSYLYNIVNPGFHDFSRTEVRTIFTKIELVVSSVSDISPKSSDPEEKFNKDVYFDILVPLVISESDYQERTAAKIIDCSSSFGEKYLTKRFCEESLKGIFKSEYIDGERVEDCLSPQFQYAIDSGPLNASVEDENFASNFFLPIQYAEFENKLPSDLTELSSGLYSENFLTNFLSQLSQDLRHSIMTRRKQNNLDLFLPVSEDIKNSSRSSFVIYSKANETKIKISNIGVPSYEAQNNELPDIDIVHNEEGSSLTGFASFVMSSNDHIKTIKEVMNSLEPQMSLIDSTPRISSFQGFPSADFFQEFLPAFFDEETDNMPNGWGTNLPVSKGTCVQKFEENGANQIPGFNSVTLSECIQLCFSGGGGNSSLQRFHDFSAHSSENPGQEFICSYIVNHPPDYAYYRYQAYIDLNLPAFDENHISTLNTAYHNCFPQLEHENQTRKEFLTTYYNENKEGTFEKPTHNCELDSWERFKDFWYIEKEVEIVIYRGPPTPNLVSVTSGGGSNPSTIETDTLKGNGNGISVRKSGGAEISGPIINLSSDRELKKSIQKISKKTLNLINSIHGYKYKLKGLRNLNYGFMAQDVRKKMPEVVNSSNEDMLSISYESFIPLLLEKIKENEKKINILKNKVEKF